MPGDFLTGLIGGLSQSFQQSLQRRAEQEQRTLVQESSILNHLATSSDDPEIRALALSGLMEMSQGTKRGGILGLGKLKMTPSFQKLMELGHATGIMPKPGGADGAGGGGGAPAPTTPPPEPRGVVDRQVGTPSSPISSLVGAAAQTETSPTTGGPPLAMSTPGADVFGTRGPVATQEALAVIRGRETDKDRGRQEAALALERQRQEGRLGVEEKKAEERRVRDEANWRARDDQLAVRMNAMAERTDKVIAASMERMNTQIGAAEKSREAREFMVSKQRLTDQLAQINQRRVRLHTQQLTPTEKASAVKELDSAFDDAYGSFYREIGKPMPKTDSELGQGGGAGAAPTPTSVPPSITTSGPPTAGGPPPPPAAPARPAASPTPGTVTASATAAPGGPPAAPVDLASVPNGRQIISQVEALKRAKKTPQEILALATPHLSPLQLEALKLYLGAARR